MKIFQARIFFCCLICMLLFSGCRSVETESASVPAIKAKKGVLHVKKSLPISNILNTMAERMEFHPVFTDHAVLQQGKDIYIFGKASPHKMVKVSFAGKTKKAIAGSKGYWNVKFPSMNAGGPYELTLHGKNSTLTLQDIMIGDVYLFAGDQALFTPTRLCPDLEQNSPERNCPAIRFYMIHPEELPYPVREPHRPSSWHPAVPQYVSAFPSAAFFTALSIHKRTGNAVGMITAVRNDSTISGWFPRYEAVTEQEKKSYSEHCRKFEALQKKAFNDLQKLSKRTDNPVIEAAAAEKDNSADWLPITLPCVRDDSVLAGFNGMLVFKQKVFLPASWAGKALKMELENIDESIRFFFNGKEIDGTVCRRTEKDRTLLYRSFEIPASFVKSGNNSLSIFVTDLKEKNKTYGAGIFQIASVDSPAEKIALSGDWKCKKILQLPEKKEFVWKQKTSVYNAMLHPFSRTALSGIFWYHSMQKDPPREVFKTLPEMISLWRKDRGEQIPFYLVQSGRIDQDSLDTVSFPAAVFREAVRKTSESVPDTKMAVMIDRLTCFGDQSHSCRTLGQRLAVLSGRDQKSSQQAVGPEFERVERKEAVMAIYFRASSSPIRRTNELKGFEIAGPNGIFHTASAVLKDNVITVSSPSVLNPKYVRYGWGANPDCNLCNTAGYPASPFTTEPFFEDK